MYHFRKMILLWTVTFPCMLWEWLLEAFSKSWGRPGKPQNLKNHLNSWYCRHRPKFDQRGYIVGSGGLRDRFFMHSGSLWEPGRSSWTSLGHRFWRSILQGCPGTPQGTPESQGLKFLRVNWQFPGALQPQRSKLLLPTISLKPQRSKLPLPTISLKPTFS